MGFDASRWIDREKCPVHRSTNPNFFSWSEDGEWHCLACGAKGDNITFDETIRRCKCSARQALKFLRVLAGIEWKDDRISSAERRNFRQTRHRLDRAAQYTSAAERNVYLEYSREIHELERLGSQVAERFRALNQGSPEHLRGEADLARGALVLVAERLSFVRAGFYLIAFGSSKERLRFIFHPKFREDMAYFAWKAGYVIDDADRMTEIVL